MKLRNMLKGAMVLRHERPTITSDAKHFAIHIPPSRWTRRTAICIGWFTEYETRFLHLGFGRAGRTRHLQIPNALWRATPRLG